MSSYALTKRAEADLFDIFLFGYEQLASSRRKPTLPSWNMSSSFLLTIRAWAREAETIASGVRRHEHRSHIIIYEEASPGILVLALVHTSSVRRLIL